MQTERLFKIFREESTGISTDSRSITKGQIFFALWGKNHNGNQFAADALQKGASYAVIDDPAYESDRTIIVDDCLFELQSLSTFYRKELGVPVLAITGSNGKTTTKELVAAILSKKMKVHYTRNNLNNEIGVPLTILSAPADTEFMVIEMGANHIGEIETLCKIVRPDYGLITNIGTAHIEGFGSWDGVARAKTELYEYLRKINGIAFYNDENFDLKQRIFRLVNRAVPFSAPAGIPLIIQALPSDANLRVFMRYRNESFEVNTKLFGAYNLENIRAATAISLFFGVGIKDIIEAVQNYEPGNNRSQFRKTDKNTLICDSYNANPTSMSLALKDFAGINAGRKMVILGDMLELGSVTEEEHQKILDLIQSLNFDRVVLVGPVFKKINKGRNFECYKSTDLLCEELRKKGVSGYHILIKGSRGMSLEKTYGLL